MKQLAVLSTLAMLALPHLSFGQNTVTTQPKPLKRIIVKDIFIQNSNFSNKNTNGSFSDFQMLAPQSSILNNANTANLSSFGNDFYSYGFGGNNALSASLGIQFADSERKSYKTNPLLRLGISYNNSTALYGYSSYDQRSAADTLTSSQNGSQVYVDSVISNSYNMNYTSEQMKLEGSLLFRTNPAARWSVFTGVGFSFGFSINSYTNISYNRTESLESRYSNGNTSITYINSDQFSADNYKTEQIRNKRNHVGSLYIPVGLDFRVGNKSEFWKRMHLFYEIRAGITRTNIPELRKTTSVGAQHGFGLRYSWE